MNTSTPHPTRTVQPDPHGPTDLPAPTFAVTIDNAARMVGISRRTYYRCADAGELPRPVKLGRRSVVLVLELRAAMERLGERRR